MEEYLDVVDENDRLVGEQPRSVVHKSGVWHRGVHVLLFTADNRLIVQQRSAQRIQSPNALDCSVSEHVQAGESYLDAARRGLNEELGISEIPLECLLHFRLDYGPNDFMISKLYRGSVEDGKVRIDPIEVEQVIYQPADKLELLLAGQAPLSRWFEHLLRWYLGKPTELHVLAKDE